MFLTGTSLVSLDPKTGKLYWRFSWETPNDANVATPLALGNYVYLVGVQHGFALVEVHKEGDGLGVRQVYKNNLMRNHYATCTFHKDYLYGFDEGYLECMPFRTGKRRLWKEGKFGRGNLLLAGNHLIVLGINGKLALVEATPEGYREKALCTASENPCWTMPALAHGRLYLRQRTRLVPGLALATKKKFAGGGRGGVTSTVCPSASFPGINAMYSPRCRLIAAGLLGVLSLSVEGQPPPGREAKARTDRFGDPLPEHALAPWGRCAFAMPTSWPASCSRGTARPCSVAAATNPSDCGTGKLARWSAEFPAPRGPGALPCRLTERLWRRAPQPERYGSGASRRAGSSGVCPVTRDRRSRWPSRATARCWPSPTGRASFASGTCRPRAANRACGSRSPGPCPRPRLHTRRQNAGLRGR